MKGSLLLLLLLSNLILNSSLASALPADDHQLVTATALDDNDDSGFLYITCSAFDFLIPQPATVEFVFTAQPFIPNFLLSSQLPRAPPLF